MYTCVHICIFRFLSLIYVPSSRKYYSSLASLSNFRKIYQFTCSFLVIFYIFKLQLLFNHRVVFLTIFQAKFQFFEFLRALSWCLKKFGSEKHSPRFSKTQKYIYDHAYENFDFPTLQTLPELANGNTGVKAHVCR